MPSPVYLTRRPWCSRILGSTNSRRCALKRSCVPSSSARIRREYPTASAASIAARRRVEAIRRNTTGVKFVSNELYRISVPGEAAGVPRRRREAYSTDARFAVLDHQGDRGGVQIVRASAGWPVGEGCDVLAIVVAQMAALAEPDRVAARGGRAVCGWGKGGCCRGSSRQWAHARAATERQKLW